MGNASRKDNSTGAMNDRLQLKTCDIPSARAVPKASRMILLAATGSTSVGVTQVSAQPDIQLAQEIQHRVISGVNNHRGLRAHP